MSLEWLPPVTPLLPNLRPYLVRSTCLRYRIDKSWLEAGNRYYAWHVTTTAPERVGEFTDFAAAKKACVDHLETLNRRWRDELRSAAA